MLTSRTYAPLTDTQLVASLVHFGTASLTIINVQTGECERLDLPVNDVRFDAIDRVSEDSILLIGTQPKVALAVYKIKLGSPPSLFTIRAATEQTLDERYFSKPELIKVPSKSKPDRTIYGLLWLPQNPRFKAPEGKLPPLIVNSHGGPTGYTGPGLKLPIQYYTTRGYAVFALNYTGSTGHGKEYRELLFGRWGIVDADDAAECAEFLANAGRVNPKAMGISGPSAGGYNVLQTIIRHPQVFAGASCICGISNVHKLAATTHKLEAKYMYELIIPPGTPEGDIERIFNERSPVFHANKIETPLVLIHGSADSIVPVEQAKGIYEVLKGKGRDVKLVIVNGEGHLFRNPGSLAIWLTEEERWLRKALLAEPN
jgi:dipeptidyl aminopeptidase/acylaminoacyl peptidase